MEHDHEETDMLRSDRRQQRREQAAERQAARDARGDQAQLDKLVRDGHGECREAERLRERIENATNRKESK